jgi:hypothetical protein
MKVFTLFLALLFEKTLQQIKNEESDQHRDEVIDLEVSPLLGVNIEKHDIFKLR